MKIVSCKDRSRKYLFAFFILYLMSVELNVEDLCKITEERGSTEDTHSLTSPMVALPGSLLWSQYLCLSPPQVVGASPICPPPPWKWRIGLFGSS